MRTPMVFLIFLTFCQATVFGQAKGRSRPGAFETGAADPGTVSELPLLQVLEFSLREPSGNNILDAEEVGELRFTIRNAGRRPAFTVIPQIVPENPLNGLSVASARTIEKLSGSDSIEIAFTVTASGAIPTGDFRGMLHISEKNGFDLDPAQPFRFSTKERQLPNIVLTEHAIKDLTNQNGMIEPREFVEITLRLQNRGYGRGDSVEVNVTLGPNVFFEGEGLENRTQTWNLGTMQPGAYVDRQFTIYTNNVAKSVPITVGISNLRSAAESSFPLDLAFNKPQKKSSEMKAVPTSAGAPIIAVAPSLLPDVDQNLPKTESHNPDAIAVVIGNSRYQKTRPVEYAENDASSIRKYLVEVAGFKEGNIFFETNITKSDFELFFGTGSNPRGKLFNAVKPAISDVFIYYSGHGAPGLQDKRGYFVPVECDPQYVEIQGYPLDVLYENLSKIPAKSITLVTDACFSGGQYENISPIVIKMEAPAFAMTKGVVMSSSTGSQVSSWYNEKHHGMFTYFFLKAIHSRNADINGDGVLTYEEIQEYVSDKTSGVPYYARRIHGIDQDPTIQGNNASSAFIRYE